jgi:hypothetical protein
MLSRQAVIKYYNVKSKYRRFIEITLNTYIKLLILWYYNYCIVIIITLLKHNSHYLGLVRYQKKHTYSSPAEPTDSLLTSWFTLH